MLDYYSVPGTTEVHVGNPRHLPLGVVKMPSNAPSGCICSTEGCEPGYGTWVQGYPDTVEGCRAKFKDTLDSGFLYNGVLYQCQANNIDDLDKALSHMERKGALTITVRAYDNSMHTMSYDQFKELCIAAGDAYDAARRTYWGEVDAL